MARTAVKLIAGFLFLVTPLTSFAAITFGNTAFVNAATLSFNNDGTGIIVCMSPDTDASAVTWNGSEALTKAGAALFANSRYQQIWYILSATGGTHNIVVTGGGDVYMRASSITGVGSVNAYNTNNGSGTTPSVSVTTTLDSAYAIGCGQHGGTSSAGANTTAINNSAPSSIATFWRSTNAVSPAGAFTINVNADSSTWGLVGAALEPPGAAAATFQVWPLCTF